MASAGAARLDEQAGQELGGLAVVLVVGVHALEQGDGPVAVARLGGGLAALEGEPRLLVQLDGLVAVSRLLVEPGRRLDLAGPLVAGGGAVLEPGADVDGARRRVAVAGLVGAGGLGQHSHGLEQLRRAQVVLALLEEGRRLGDASLLERHLAAQVGGLHRDRPRARRRRRRRSGPRRA